ncbi:MAG: hypothetical protein IPP32_00020 [Bacteroidetes bacterium]|nr:hypothetical protein [Bacteroidota bacterium]
MAAGSESWDNAPGGCRYTAEQIAVEYNATVADPSSYGLGGSADANPTGQPSNPHESFIPTVSALGMFGNPSLTTNVSSTIQFDNLPSPQYPFDAYYASSTNKLHVELESGLTAGNSAPAGNMDWAHKEILNSEPTLPFLLNASSPNAGTYNMCRIQNRFLTNCTVDNGGFLLINRNTNADFSFATSPMPPAGVNPPIQGSTFEVQTCDCGVTIDIKAGGVFILGDDAFSNKAVVTFHSGDNLYLRSGSRIKIEDYSKLILEQGVNLIIEPGAQIILQGEHSLFDVQGICDINIPTNGTILFDKGSASTGGEMHLNTGTFIINGNANLTSNQCKIKLNDYVFNYRQNAHINLNGEESTLQFGGIINLQPQAGCILAEMDILDLN